MHATTLALVGATGGAGTTRTAVELAAIGARDGLEVAVVDAAFTTQGLSEYVSGRIDPDLTTLLTDEPETSLSAAAYPIAGGNDARGEDTRGAVTNAAGPALPGRVDAIPTRAPFERLARAKTAEAARTLERRIDEAATAYDAVVADAAPLGSNEAVAAATCVDRAVAVRPATAHGRDATQRLRGRMADVGGGFDATLAVDRAAADGEGETDGVGDKTVEIPTTDPLVSVAPTAATGEDPHARAMTAAYETAFDTPTGIEFADPGLVDRFTR